MTETAELVQITHTPCKYYIKMLQNVTNTSKCYSFSFKREHVHFRFFRILTSKVALKIFFSCHIGQNTVLEKRVFQFSNRSSWERVIQFFRFFVKFTIVDVGPISIRTHVRMLTRRHTYDESRIAYLSLSCCVLVHAIAYTSTHLCPDVQSELRSDLVG